MNAIMNRPFPSSPVPLFQSESKCETFHFHANQSHFHKNGFALRLVLKQRHKGTRKWSIDYWKIDPTSRSKNMANGIKVEENQSNIVF